MGESLDKRETYLVRSATGTRECATSYRNYYLVGEEDPDYQVWEGLVARGLAVRGRTNSIGRFFHVAKAGARILNIRLQREDEYG